MKAWLLITVVCATPAAQKCVHDVGKIFFTEAACVAAGQKLVNAAPEQTTTFACLVGTGGRIRP